MQRWQKCRAGNASRGSGCQVRSAGKCFPLLAPPPPDRLPAALALYRPTLPADSSWNKSLKDVGACTRLDVGSTRLHC